MTQWNLAASEPPIQGLIRERPEDFIVEECLPIEPEGEGEHLWLQVRKRGLNTEFVARALARTAGIAKKAVGYAGLKDRHALTTQWFSLHLPGRGGNELTGDLPEGIEILQARRHTRKLKTGALRGNRFRITVRQCTGERAALDERLETVRRQGVPNYFGDQRFGREGGNVDKARALFAGELKLRDRHVRGLYLSAARAYLLNAVLSRRVGEGSWDQALSGEAFMLEGSRSFFVPEAVDEAVLARLAQGDIHPSGPLWGRGASPVSGAVEAIEADVLNAHADLATGLEAAGLKHERRALRLLVRELHGHWRDETTLELGFELPAGTYATTVLRELVRLRDVSADPGS